MMIYIDTKVLKENINLWHLINNGCVENVMEKKQQWKICKNILET
jgi:hypothetical protein